MLIYIARDPILRILNSNYKMAKMNTSSCSCSVKYLVSVSKTFFTRLTVTSCTVAVTKFMDHMIIHNGLLAHMKKFPMLKIIGKEFQKKYYKTIFRQINTEETFLPFTTSSKKTSNLTFLDCHSHCDNCVF